MAPSRGLITLLRTSSTRFICPRCRSRLLTTTTNLLSGHNRWSKIKHDKGKADAIKNRQRSLFAQEIASNSRLFGPDPTLNSRLAETIGKAKKEGFPKSSIDAAIARGQGRSLSGASLESVTVEGLLPGNVAVIVECETESRLRTLMDVKLAMKDAGGSSTPTAYLFGKRGRVEFEAKEGIGIDEVLDVALDAGATDVEESNDGGVIVFSEPGQTKTVSETISNALGLQIKASEIIWCANEDTKVEIDNEAAAEELSGFIDELLEKEPNVQTIAMNIMQGDAVDGAVWKDLVGRLSV